MRASSRGVGIEYEVTGEGRPVVMIHGFPDTGRLWRHQVPALADAGFKVIVPDLRGYGRSDKPPAVHAYAIPAIAADVLAVMSDAGAERAHLVGHDWGAAVAWALAGLASERVDHLAVLSVGHPATFRSGGYEQHEKSWYMLLFQFPGVAEEWLSSDDWANFRAWSRHPDADAVIAELRDNGSLTPGLNYYRANLPPEVWLEPRTRAPADRRSDDGAVELGRHRAHRAADDGLGSERDGTVALRAARRPGALDATRGARRGEPLAARLPAQLKLDGARTPLIGGEQDH